MQGSDEASRFLNKNVSIVPQWPLFVLATHILVWTICGIASILPSMCPPNIITKSREKQKRDSDHKEMKVTEVTFVAGTGQAFSHLTITMTLHLSVLQVTTLRFREIKYFVQKHMARA